MWRSSFFAIIWAIWKEINQRCFKDKCSPTEDVTARSRFIAALWASVPGVLRNAHGCYILQMEGDDIFHFLPLVPFEAASWVFCIAVGCSVVSFVAFWLRPIFWLYLACFSVQTFCTIKLLISTKLPFQKKKQKENKNEKSNKKKRNNIVFNERPAKIHSIQTNLYAFYSKKIHA